MTHGFVPILLYDDGHFRLCHQRHRRRRVEAMCSSVTTLNVKRLSPRAILPQRSSEGAVGFDLFSAETVTVPSCGQTLIATDIAVEIPQGCYGRIGNDLDSVLLLSVCVWSALPTFHNSSPNAHGFRSSFSNGCKAPRSGLAVKHGINVGAGVIDPDYRGNVKVLLFNHGTTPYDGKFNKNYPTHAVITLPSFLLPPSPFSFTVIRKSDRQLEKKEKPQTSSSHTSLHSLPLVEQGFRIAQLIIEVVITPQIVEVETLNDTERDDNGFGSTGM